MKIIIIIIIIVKSLEHPRCRIVSCSSKERKEVCTVLKSVLKKKKLY